MINKHNQSLKIYFAWDRSTRWFHWINVICVAGLVALGLFILNAKGLGVSKEGKILLKTIHTYFGYVFALNLLWRIIWGFYGHKNSRWKNILPLGKEYFHNLKNYMAGLVGKNAPLYLGHNPLARLMVSLLFVLMTFQAITGLVLAGTDLYLPPFGHEIAEWVTEAGEDHSKIKDLKPGDKEAVVAEAYSEMRKFRKPFITIHLVTFYILVTAIILHIIAVVVMENIEKSGIVSAMFTGTKTFSCKPKDFDESKD